jgi:hypothetical protein
MTTTDTLPAVAVADPIAALLERKTELAMMNEILNMEWYADAWLQLAAEFEKFGYPSNAEDCNSRGIHYHTFTRGEYIKLVDGPFAEMILVEEKAG